MKRVKDIGRQYLPDIKDQLEGHDQEVRESEQYYIDAILEGHPFILLLSRLLPGNPKTDGYSVEDLRFARVSLVSKGQNKCIYQNALVLALEQVIEVSIGDNFLLELDSSQPIARQSIIEYFNRFTGFRGIATFDTWQNPEK